LLEWQYSAGIVLEKMFQPDLPEWRVQIGVATEPKPLYEGSSTYHALNGPVIDVRYKDIAFASVGEGFGVNVLRGDNYRAGVAVGYDLGRRQSQDLENLKGLGNIEVAPVVKFFASYAVSKAVPLVLRVDARRFAGGANGWVGDVEAYMPLPGSSKTLILFAGPAVTFATRSHMQTAFGVNAGQALGSGYPQYNAGGGADSAGLGFSATRIISSRWLVNANLAVDRLLGSAIDSPITQKKVEGVLSLSVAYNW
jgi:outer membrane scaffolding protein for murein synthesis (MipA/OmpV family)